MEQEDLHQLEDRCIQERSPACAAACPIHVDVRAMAARAAKGDFTGAAKVFKKTVPFPGIVSRVCDHPCQNVCRRGEVGDAVSVRALERACLTWASHSNDALQLLPRKEKKVAIVGGGLSGLTAAFDLGKKGYGVVVLEKENRLGGSLWRFSEDELPRRIMDEDLSVLERVGVEVRPGVALGRDVSLDELVESFDAVLLALGENPLPQGLGLAVESPERLVIDAASFSTSRDGVFAAGSMHRPIGEGSPIQSMAEGRRAAITVDRYLGRVSLTASRADEGSTTTRLYTSTEGIEPLPVVPMEDPPEGYSREEAIREAARCIQCQCLECVKVCEYLNSFGAYPKKYVRQIYNNLSIVMGHRHANKLINSCSLCGLCKEVCPEDLHMGLVCRNAREVLVDKGKMPPSAHDFPIRDMLFSNSEKCTLQHHEPGTSASEYLFFPGCQLSGSYPDQVREIYGHLREKLEGGVGIMLRCCGAPADWSGRRDLFQSGLQEFKELYKDLGSAKLIVACSTCYEMFKTHLPEASIVSLWEVLDTVDTEKSSRPAQPLTVAIHDACTTRHKPGIHASVRRLLERRSITVEELALSREKTECCGYGGLMFFANRELAARVIARRAAESDRDYIAYCAMCRDYLAHKGKRVIHLLDVVLGHSPEEACMKTAPGYSQRRENRVRLKNALLRELWGEEMSENSDYESIRLHVPPAMQEVLESRLILTEDLQQVIDYAEQTGNKLRNLESEHILAHHKPAAVTYWVEYSPHEDGFLIHNAYSHRMEIVEEAKP